MSFAPWIKRCRSSAKAAEPFLLWVFLSLLAIAWMGKRPYLALTIALLGGLAMGLSSVGNSCSSPWPEQESGAQKGPSRSEE
ncbi:MAG: hypothetical protein OEV76_03945 [Anaerolineae bacterium]|nr:hypothetical protein [Anaerolineae bacterium]